MYGGLRGAVGLSLALIVNLDHDIDEEIREVVLFHTAGIAFLTLLINGTTTGFIIRKLGLSRTSVVKRKMMRNLIKQMENLTKEKVCELKIKKHFNLVNWENLEELTAVSGLRKQFEIKMDLNLGASMSIPKGEAQAYVAPPPVEEELKIEARHRYLTTLKGLYWDNFEEGLCSSDAVLLLMESADRALDHEENPSKDWDFIQTYF